MFTETLPVEPNIQKAQVNKKYKPESYYSQYIVSSLQVSLSTYGWK